MQAIVVNALLLTIGVDSVMTELAYPVFDGAWLGLLGVSAVAQTVGKQVLESNMQPIDTSGRTNAPLVDRQGNPAVLPGGRVV